MNSEQKLEQFQNIIDKILEGIALNNEEKMIVESDAEFKAYQNEFDLINKGISHSALQNKLGDLNKLEEKYQSENTNAEKTRSRTLGRRSYLLLAAASILLLLSYFILSNEKEPFDGQSIAQNFTLPSPTGFESRSANDMTNVDSSYVSYLNKDYKSAIKDLEKRIAVDSNPRHKFFLAISLQHENRWSASEKILEEVELINLKDEPTYYYLAVSKTALGKIDQAIELLQNPKTDRLTINGLGKELLEKLKSYK